MRGRPAYRREEQRIKVHSHRVACVHVGAVVGQGSHAGVVISEAREQERRLAELGPVGTTQQILGASADAVAGEVTYGSDDKMVHTKIGQLIPPTPTWPTAAPGWRELFRTSSLSSGEAPDSSSSYTQPACP